MTEKMRKTDLLTGSIGKNLLLYFLPILAGSFFQQLYTVADAVILGQFAGKMGLASVDATYHLLKLPINFFIGLSAGSTILISQFFGANDETSLSKVVHTGMCFALAGGMLLSGLGVVIAPFCLKVMAVPEEIFGLSLSYIRVLFAGLGFSLLYHIGAGILRAVGDSRTPFYVLILTGCVNILLDFIFVGGFRMSAPGAALATVLSQGISAVLVLVMLFKSNAAYGLKWNELRFHKGMTGVICRLGFPVGLQSALYPMANMVVQAAVNRTGTDHIAAWALCGKLDFMVWLITDSLAVAVSTFVAQNYGAKAYMRTRKGLHVGLTMTVGMIAIISAGLFFWSVPIGRLLIHSRDVDIVLAAGAIMRFLAPLYVLYVFGEIIAGAIRGTGDTLWPMMITLVGTCVTRILWILFVVPHHEHLYWILGCYPMSWAITSLGFILYDQRHKKRCVFEKTATG